MMRRITLYGKRRFVCRKCSTLAKRNDKHDAYYCPKCDAWLEETCDWNVEPCEFCPTRPARPSEARD